MSLPVETALKIAILTSPEYFGLKPEDINPLLRFTVQLAEGEDEDSAKLVSSCFDFCNSQLYGKVTEVLRTDYTSRPTTPAKKPAKPSSGNGEIQTKPGGVAKLTIRQLKYLGYLLHQKGEAPDYKKIGELTTKQATMRIKDLEAELGVSREA